MSPVNPLKEFGGKGTTKEIEREDRQRSENIADEEEERKQAIDEEEAERKK